MTGGTRIFLAAPYSQFMDSATGSLAAPWRERLDALRLSFQKRGASVFNAHHNESWGKGWLAAEVCTPIDHRAIRHADVVCAVLGDPPSGGVLIELGWASAFQVPCLIVLPTNRLITPLVKGLKTLVAADYVTEPSVWDSDAVHDIVGRALSLLSHPGPSATPKGGSANEPAGYCSLSACCHDPADADAPPGVLDWLPAPAGTRP